MAVRITTNTGSNVPNTDALNRAMQQSQELQSLIAAQEAAKASTPAGQADLATRQAAGPMPTSGVDTILNPFARPEGVPQGAPTDLASLFGMGTAGLGPIGQPQVDPMSSPALGAGLPAYDAGMAPTMAPAVSPFAQPQVPPQLAMGQAQGQAITGATTLADLVSRGLGGQSPLGAPPQAPQIPQLAQQPFAPATIAAPQMAPQAAFPQAPGIAQPAAPAQAPAAPQGMASLFAQPAQQVQAPQQPYVPGPSPVQPPVQPAYQPPAPFQATQRAAGLPAQPAAPAPVAAPVPVAPAPVQQAAPAPAPAPVAPAPAPQQPARRGAPLETDPNAVNPQEDFPEALAARRANQRADGNDPGRPYTPAPYERPDEPAPIEQPQEQPAEAPVEPELEPAFAGSPLQNTRPAESSIEGGELVVVGRDGRRFSQGNKGISPNLLARVGLTRAVLSQFVDRAVVGEMTVPDRPMDNADDVAALAYEYLRKQPQENLMLVILDGQGRPLQILRHQLGAISSANFVPHILAGVAASTRGARTVYLVHNHPSTTTRFSQADVGAAQKIAATMEPIGLRFGGSLVVTDGDAYEGTMVPKYIFHPGGDQVNKTPDAINTANTKLPNNWNEGSVKNVVVFDDRIDEGIATTKLQVVERMFEVRKEALFPRIAEPKDAIEQIPPLLRNLPGVAMLDKAGRLVGVIQMSISEMRNVSSAASIIYQEQGQARDYIGQESDRAPGDQDKRTYRREKFNKDVGPGAWNNPLAMLMAALERSNAESVIISMGPNDVGTSGNDTRTDAVTNLQKAILRVGGQKVEVLDVINNKKNFSNLVVSQFSNAASYGHAEKTGGRMSTGERTGFNEPGTEYGAEGEGDQAPIEREAPQSLGDVVSQGMGVEEGEAASETNPDDPNAQADFDRQEREAGAGAQPSSLENAQPAEPIIKKTRKPRAKKPAAGPAGLGVSDFPRLDATPGVFGRLSGEQMAKFGLSDAMLDQFVEHSTVGKISSGVEFVKTPEEAAHVVAGMRKRPQENIVLLITDKQGRPIQIASHQLGGPASAGFNPGILIGTAASTPGAAQVWFIHNHPSGKSSLSPADLGAANAVQNLCDAAGLRYMATMAVAGSKFAYMDNRGSILSGQNIKPMPRKFSVPLTERMFSYRVSQSTEALGDPMLLGKKFLEVFGPDQPGIILADNSNRPVAAIPLDADVMQAMRANLPGTKQPGFAKYAAGVDRSGAVNMFIYTAGLDMPTAVKVIENMSKVANATKLTALDAMNNQEVTLSRHIIGYSTDFKESGSDYNRGQGEAQAPGSLQDVVEQGLSGDQKKKTKR